MTRALEVTPLSLALLAAPLIAAQPAGRVYRIGHLSLGTPSDATVRLSPTWGPTPRPLGFAPDPMLGLEFLEARSRLFQDGMGLGPVNAAKARHRPPPRRREHGRARG
jgi:hypothetical protein